MNELQRTQYLEEMGIDVFVPRFVLPAAKASVQVYLPEVVFEALNSEPDVSNVVNSSLSSVTTIADAKPVANVTGIVSNIMDALGVELAVANELPNAIVNGESEPLSAPITQMENVSFSLSLWRISSSLMVIDSHYPKQALPTTTLLSNMLLAKGIKERLPTAEVLTWPMFSHLEKHGGWLEAGDMVNAFLQARLSTQPVKYVWLMGESAFKSVTQRNNYSVQVGSALDMTNFSALALVLPSLTEILLAPELKRKVWSAIRPYNIESKKSR